LLNQSPKLRINILTTSNLNLNLASNHLVANSLNLETISSKRIFLIVFLSYLKKLIK